MTRIDELYKEYLAKKDQQKKASLFSEALQDYLESAPDEANTLAAYYYYATGKEPTTEQLSNWLAEIEDEEKKRAIYNALVAGRPAEPPYTSTGLPTRETPYSPESYTAIVREALRLGPGVGYSPGDEAYLRSSLTSATSVPGIMQEIKQSPAAQAYKAKTMLGREGLLNVLKNIFQRQRLERAFMPLPDIVSRWKEGVIPTIYGTWAGSAYGNKLPEYYQR